ncbi:MAG TPA: hypothetical protein VFF98_00450 [Novosphingobium sp.]|nr:hypothetical protein [Novosphingobium sp.]
MGSLGGRGQQPGRAPAALGLAALLLLAPPALAAPPLALPPQEEPHATGQLVEGLAAGEPSEVFSAELQMKLRARAKGDRDAIKRFASPEAQVADARQPGHAPLAGRQPPALSQRSAFLAWVSCDGTVALTQGRLPAAGVGEAHSRSYLTVWQRQRKGTPYRFVLDLVSQQGQSPADPDFAEGHVAQCPLHRRGDAGPVGKPGKPSKVQPPAFTADTPERLTGEAQDHTLRWELTTPADGAPFFALYEKIASAPKEAPAYRPVLALGSLRAAAPLLPPTPAPTL